MAALLRFRKKGPPSLCQKIRTALDRYKANPLAPDALHHLRTCFMNVEEITELRKRNIYAKIVLEELSEVRCGSSSSALEKLVERSLEVDELIWEFPDMKRSLEKRIPRGDVFFDSWWGKVVSTIIVMGANLFIINAIAKVMLGLPVIQSPRMDNNRNPALVQKCQCKKPSSRQWITPSDPLVMKAIVHATKPGPLSISQILDAYDFVVSHIEYRNGPALPRRPAETLAPIFKYCDSRKCKSIADCKSMTGVLASMLEGMGADTELIIVPRHVYLGVLVARRVNVKDRFSVTETISKKIEKRYGSWHQPEFRCYKKKNGYDVYLLLDPTTGRVPGVVGSKKVIGSYESRPGQGFVPLLE